MSAEVSAPGVQAGDHARQGAEVLFVSEQFLEGGDGGLKQEVGHQPVVVPPQVVELMRQGEDRVVVVAGEQFCFDFIQPALGGQGRALGAGGVFAGVVPDLLHVAVGAALDVSAERLGAALHDGPGRLDFVQRLRMGLQIGVEVVLEDALHGGGHAGSIAVIIYSFYASAVFVPFAALPRLR